MTPVIFISYSVKDGALASAIHAFLNSSGIKALKAPDDIAPGTNWATAITEMIEGCTHMVLVWSSNSMASQEVSKELTLAMQCGAVIIPFRSEALAPEGAWRYHLSQVQWLEAHGMAESDALEALLYQLSGTGPSTVPVAKPYKTSPESDVGSPQKITHPNPSSARKRKLTAGLLALFLGFMGAHKFYLGRILPGCIYLALLTLLLVTGSFMSDGTGIENAADFAGVMLFLVIPLTALAEALTYFARSVEDFERINIKGKRPWF